ncbi:MAG: ribonuclease J [Alphaproteobacteria bacterium]
MVVETGWSPNDLVFLPLGGAGEIGMNLNLYGHAGKWLAIDCGVTFGDETTPGADVIMPDPTFLAERRDDLVGLVLTHAHEDHIGAVQYLWTRLQCPMYATPFTAAVLRHKLADAGVDAEVTEIAMSSRIAIGPFELELITLTHSIPEPNAVAVRTPAGTVLHTGDWKLDPTPPIGETTDEAALRRLGEDGVLAVVGDSTNALVDGTSGSEADLHDSLSELVGRSENRVAVTCFSSNVARVQTIAEVAAEHGRHVALVGRSLWRITEAARQTGYLDRVPPFLTQYDAGYLPRDKVLLICTGSQGEPRSALFRISRDDHPHVALGEGDVVIFSSRIIPGNEKSINQLHNQLLALGVDVITAEDHFVHVSGHPARDELVSMYQWVRPRIVVPVHGEVRHMLGHAELARECQVQHTPVILNGDVLRLSGSAPEVVGQAPVGRLAVDGTRLITLDGDDMRSRQKMLWNGCAVLTLVVDSAGELLADPELSAPGVLGPTDEELARLIVDDVLDALDALPAAERRVDASLRAKAATSMRRSFRNHRGKRPQATVHVVRI